MIIASSPLRSFSRRSGCFFRWPGHLQWWLWFLAPQRSAPLSVSSHRQQRPHAWRRRHAVPWVPPGRCHSRWTRESLAWAGVGPVKKTLPYGMKGRTRAAKICFPASINLPWLDFAWTGSKSRLRNEVHLSEILANLWYFSRLFSSLSSFWQVYHTRNDVPPQRKWCKSSSLL